MSRHNDYVLNQRWYVYPNDLVGGYSIMNCDKPPSQADHRQGEYEVAMFVSFTVAGYIAGIHNVVLAAFEARGVSAWENPPTTPPPPQRQGGV